MEDPVVLTPPLTKSHLNALDALALALYSASYHGRRPPEPESVLLELVQRGWMIVPIPMSTESTAHPQNLTLLPPSDSKKLANGNGEE